MAEAFYTNFTVSGNDILYRGVVEGRRVSYKLKYKPTLYLEGEGSWRTLNGISLEPKTFDSILHARSFLKTYKGIDNFRIWGNTNFPYAFVDELFPEGIVWDPKKVVVAYIDIEVASSNGFPYPDTAEELITAITLLVDDTYHIFGYYDFVPKENQKYYQCSDEIDLITKFMKVWGTLKPDIITGWNINAFDLPYLINRTVKILGESVAAKISPWHSFTMKTKRIGFKEQDVYEIAGIAILDYQDLYRKFARSPNQESYALGYISSVELEETKLDYSGYGNLTGLYEKNYQLFMEYNVKDVELVAKLEKKQKLIELAFTLAYTAKVNYEDAFSQVRMWDAISCNKLKRSRIAVPQKEGKVKTESFVGAYVKDPPPGWYKWVVSFDLRSLYPHLIMTYNLSPETLIEPFYYSGRMRSFIAQYGSKINVDTILNQEFDLLWLKAEGATLAPNGQFFRTNKPGFLTELMAELYEGRAANKDKMLAAQAQLELATGSKEELERQIAVFSALQQAQKVSLNSAYGVIGSPYFRFFDVRIATAITMGGQLAIRWIQQELNTYMNKLLKTNDDFVIASDTDSVYLSMDKLIQHIHKEPITDIRKVVRLIDRICEDTIKPFIDDCYLKLARYVNAYDQKMVMKREAICDVAIWVAKKNYILNVYNNEGVEYKEPKIKIVGLEAVRQSAHPAAMRKKLKETIKVVLRGSEEETMKFIQSFREEFRSLPVSTIAFPRGVNGIKKYGDAETIFGHKTPMHCRAALIHNYYVKKLGLENKYEQIKEGEKIRYVYLREPNPFQSNVIAFVGSIPEEFELDEFIDYTTMYEKTYLAPMLRILTAIGWHAEKQDVLDDLFE